MRETDRTKERRKFRKREKRKKIKTDREKMKYAHREIDRKESYKIFLMVDKRRISKGRNE